MADPFAQIRAVMDVLPVGVLLVVAGETPEGARTDACNSSYASIVGGAPMGGSDAPALPHAYYRPDRVTPIPTREWPAARAISTGESVRNQEFHLRRPDGSWRVALTGAAPVRDGERIVGAVVVAQDITSQKELEGELKASEARLRDANRHKDKFLAVLSHELRTPLAAIRQRVALLTRSREGGEQVGHALAAIDRYVNHIVHLVEDLLDVSRVASGKVRLRLARVELRDLVQRVVEDHESMLAAAEIGASLELPPGPVFARADATRLEQVLGNLLENAVKFTPAGGLVVVGIEADEATVRVFVRDSGVGIDPKAMEKLFVPFSQAEATLARSRGGLGLGLAVVKGLVELHGGTVRARSDGPGTGAEFSFTLPLEPDSSG